MEMSGPQFLLLFLRILRIRHGLLEVTLLNTSNNLLHIYPAEELAMWGSFVGGS